MSANDVINRALDEIVARAEVTDYLTDQTQAGRVARRWYAVTRKRLLRAAPWGFARKTLLLTELANAQDDPDEVPYPWQVKYTYPADCVKMRYLLPPPFPVNEGDPPPDVSSGPLIPWGGPSRQWRFLPGFTPEDDPDPAVKFLIANLPDAYGVYTADVEDDTLWDDLFMDAMEAVLAYRFVAPLTGNVGMKAGYATLAKEAVTQARAVDGNEAIPSADHVVDWMEARISGPGWGGAGTGGWTGPGYWYDGFDLNWGM